MKGGLGTKSRSGGGSVAAKEITRWSVDERKRTNPKAAGGSRAKPVDAPAGR